MTNLSPELLPPRSRTLAPRWSPQLAVGTVLIVAITLFGLVGPLVVGDPDRIDNIGLTPPGGGHLLGTTQTGQDVLAQIAYATCGSLYIGVLVGVLATVLSALFGIVGTYLGRGVDEAF